MSTNPTEDDEISFHPTSEIATEEELSAGGIDMSPVKRNFIFRRATDLLPPPIGNSFKCIQTGEKDVKPIIQEWVSSALTGCVIASNNTHKTRSALLLYQGRAVGCIYTTKTMPLTQPTEDAIKLVVRDLEFPNGTIKAYPLHESTILPLSALFLGYPVFRSDDLSAEEYIDYICKWLKNRGQTACLAISLMQSFSTCLCFIHQGTFSSAFYVEDQEVVRDQKFVMELLRNEPGANVEASILPPDLGVSEPYGFNILEE
ncbi:MAG TPA: hypothetical protein V6C89_03340 [Drouetiella sp.]|jgi:hypothetical protein